MYGVPARNAVVPADNLYQQTSLGLGGCSFSSHFPDEKDAWLRQRARRFFFTEGMLSFSGQGTADLENLK